mgnify:CR=1 FL=1
MTEAETHNAEFVRLAFEEGWNRSSFEFMNGRTAGTIPFHYNGTTIETAGDSLPALVARWRSGFPDLTMDIRHLIARDDLVAVSLTLRGTHEGAWGGHEPSGATVAVEEMMFFRFDGGLLVEMWEVFDEQGLLSQISGSH